MGGGGVGAGVCVCVVVVWGSGGGEEWERRGEEWGGEEWGGEGGRGKERRRERGYDLLYFGNPVGPISKMNCLLLNVFFVNYCDVCWLWSSWTNSKAITYF